MSFIYHKASKSISYIEYFRRCRVRGTSPLTPMPTPSPAARPFIDIFAAGGDFARPYCLFYRLSFAALLPLLFYFDIGDTLS